ncbi:MAG: redoxin family protein [Myxococcota bacterium]|nr:redoxin family protein [Myxococcota bacterium]
MSVRITGADGEVPQWIHVYLGSRGQSVVGGALEAGIPPGGVRVLRLMSPLHEPVTLPLLDQGRDVQVDVRLGTPNIPDDLSAAHLLSKRGKTFRFGSLGDGRLVASVDTADLREGVLVVGASRGPMSLGGAIWYEPTPQGQYWSKFNPRRDKVSMVVTLSPGELRDQEAATVVQFAEPADSLLYEIVRWHEEQSRQLLISARADFTAAADSRLQLDELAERAAGRLEGTARSLAEKVDRASGRERHLWLLTGVALLDTPEHRVQAADYAGVLATNAALSRMERMNPEAARTEVARRYLGAMRPGDAPPELRLYAAEERGARIHLEAFAGRTILVSFWHTWAQGSVELFVELRRLEEKYKERQFSVLNVSLNQDPVALAKFVAKNREGLPGIQAIVDARDRDELSKAYGILSVPSLV